MADYTLTTTTAVSRATVTPIIATASPDYTLRMFSPYTEISSTREPYEEVLMVLKDICDILADLYEKKKLKTVDFDLTGIRDFLDSIKTENWNDGDPPQTFGF